MRKYGAQHHSWQGGLQEGICKQCNSIFLAPRWELKNRKFCSRECYWESKKVSDKHSLNNIKPHVLIVEKILGKRLPSKAVVHHSDRNSKNNELSNLVVCQDQAYHLLLHARMRILEAGGNPDTDKICSRCKKVKPKTDFHKSNRTDRFRCYCKDCQSKIYYEGRLNHGDREDKYQSSITC